MTSTAILDFSTEAYLLRLRHEDELHDALTREVVWGELTYSCRYRTAPVFIELPGQTLAWEHTVLERLAVTLIVLLAVATVYPLVYVLWANLSENRRPSSLQLLANERFPYRGIHPDPEEDRLSLTTQVSMGILA